MRGVHLADLGPDLRLVALVGAGLALEHLQRLGAIARPSRVHFLTVLPKTRSGKLLRRSIQALAEGRDPGDLTTIEDPAALEQLQRALGTKA